MFQGRISTRCGSLGWENTVAALPAKLLESAASALASSLSCSSGRRSSTLSAGNLGSLGRDSRNSDFFSCKKVVKRQASVRLFPNPARPALYQQPSYRGYLCKGPRSRAVRRKPQQQTRHSPRVLLSPLLLSFSSYYARPESLETALQGFRHRLCLRQPTRHLIFPGSEIPTRFEIHARRAFESFVPFSSSTTSLRPRRSC